MITEHGHIILYIGNNKWHDSYGKCSEKTLAYNGEGFTTDGSNIEYSEKFVLERIFRNLDPTPQGKTIKTNVARTCWYYTGL